MANWTLFLGMSFGLEFGPHMCQFTKARKVPQTEVSLYSQNRALTQNSVYSRVPFFSLTRSMLAGLQLGAPFVELFERFVYFEQ